MNSLYTTQTKYNTSELLKQFVKLSEFRLTEARNRKGSDEGWYEAGIVSFNMGRHAGHTTAIIDYLKRGEYVVVATPNSQMIQHIRANVCFNHNGIFVSMLSIRNECWNPSGLKRKLSEAIFLYDRAGHSEYDKDLNRICRAFQFKAVVVLG